MFMGGSPSIPVLVTVPEVKTYAELRGKTLAVDAVTTGYAFVLFDLLKRNGLQPGDYRVEPVGGTQVRWQGMRERKYAASMLTSPFDLIAKADGFNVLQYAKDVYGHYEESVATTRRAWAAENENRLLAYIRAYVAAVEWLRDPNNKDEAISILRKGFLNWRRISRRGRIRISSVRAALRQRGSSISRGCARFWNCEANVAARRKR
jgi:ABC-type nitrate/sulfonate/bicarbonate transport system substrate-binding protein